MRHLSSTLVAAFMCLAASAGAAARGPTTRTSSDGLVSVTFPDRWQDYAREESTLGACDPTRRVFFLMRSDNKQDFVDMTLEDYARTYADYGRELLQDVEIGEYMPARVGEFPAIRVAVRGVQERVRWIYTMTLIETDNYFHWLVVVTRPSALKEGQAAMEDLLKSFQEHDPEASDAGDPSTTAPGR